MADRSDPRNRLPLRAIALALALLSLGTLLLSLGLMLTLGWDRRYEDRGTPLLVIGSICFLPGACLTLGT
jgi:hypothetical protein